MLPHLLATHNLLRWVFLIFIVISLVQAYSGWFGNKSYTKSADRLRLFTVITAHLQLIFGLILYFVSPLVKSFLANPGASMKDANLRFYGMEHLLMMVIAIVLVTIGSAKSKNKPDTARFKALAIWFTIALIIVLLAAPSQFSPMNYRPNFRGF